MIRTLFKVVLVVILVAAAAAFFVGYRFAGNGVEEPISAERAVPSVDTQKARETGAKVGEAVATGAVQAQQVLNEGSLTAKIKSKMALDDTVKALSIDVDTDGTEVTFQEPRFSGSTSAHLMTTPNTSLTSSASASQGTVSDEINFQFVDATNTRWIRLTTFNTPNLPNPVIDFANNSSLTFQIRGVIVPEPASAAVFGLGASVLMLVRRRK